MLDIEKMSSISMNGRMAYIILCIEKYLLQKYPDKDWKDLSCRMWRATSEPWDEWIDEFIEIIPQYLFEFDNYDESDFEELSEEEYDYFVELYEGVSEGLCDNPSDKVNYMLNSLKELEEVYCYTSIPGIGKEAIDILAKVASVLVEENVELPDVSIVEFSAFVDKNGWGENFDGTNISLINQRKV